MAVLYRGLEKNGMVRAWHGHGIGSVDQTRPHCVNQMGKTHSKPLAARHGKGTAWVWCAMCESASTKTTEKIKCNIEQFYHTFLYNYLRNDCIFVVGHPDDGHRHYHNMLVNNSNNVIEHIYKHVCVGLSHKYKTNCTLVWDCHQSLMKLAKQQN